MTRQPTLSTDIRPGAYADSIVLMRLQAALADLPGVDEAGAVMGTAANKAILEAQGLLSDEAARAADGDLVLVVRASSPEAAEEALGRATELLARRRADAGGEYRPKSLAAAVKQMPEATWVAVSVPGRHAAVVAEEALSLGKHVFLYSDNVPLGEEVALKEKARERGLLVLGPDCGTAVIGGVGLGFANRVKRGDVGIVAASGTGLQALLAGLDREGLGISQAFGTGGRDLSGEVGGLTTLGALSCLGADPATAVIVLVAKPPSPAVAARVIGAARATGKAVVICLLGFTPPGRRVGNLHFASSLAEAATLVARLRGGSTNEVTSGGATPGEATPGEAIWTLPGPWLRGLFSGGTLAYEALLQLRALAGPLGSNLGMPGVLSLADPAAREAHTIVDLGEDEYTVGRPHPMIDPSLRREHLWREGRDPGTGLLLLDVVLGDGAHPNPAGDLAPVLRRLGEERPGLPVLAVLVGTGGDPQDLAAQQESLIEAGARVYADVVSAVNAACLRGLWPAAGPGAPPATGETPALGETAVINVGVETFAESLDAQGAPVLHVDWRPPAGGNEKLAGILARMKGG